MGEVENWGFERICQEIPEIEAIRLEVLRLAIQWAGNKDMLFTLWHGRNGATGLRRRISDALGVMASDAEQYNKYYSICCRESYQLLRSGAPLT
jgi:hypothetical protein